jgi:sphingolipid delta-4 desaturase
MHSNTHSIDFSAPVAQAKPAVTFLVAKPQRPHPVRRRAILNAHPEIAGLIGSDSLTAVITLAVVLGQTAIAAVFGSLGFSYWWAALLAAYGIGAFANHAMFVVIHDATHNCVFESNRLNKWAAIVADLPNAVPTAMGFRCYHMKHHSHLGDYDYDADLPSRWEARFFGQNSLGKAAWFFFFPFLQLFRLNRLKGTVPMWGRWTFINASCIIAYDLIILALFGPAALFYLFMSFWFSVGGLHPLAARWVQEHFTFDPEQETSGYYGPLNLIALNIGYHNEHHDFPDIPWRRLPEVKRLAPEFYNGLRTHQSWAGLFFQFIFDPRFSLFSRVDRSAETASQNAAIARP